jgi:hypothetical protein
MNVKVSNPNKHYGLIGKEMLKLWKERYPSKENPPKGKQIYQGRATLVNTYYEKDQDLLEIAIKKVLNLK